MLYRNYCLALLLSGLTFSASAAQLKPLPDPLSLEQALHIIDEDHPALLKARLDKLYAQVDLQSAEADDSVHVDLDGRLRWVDSNHTSSRSSSTPSSRDHKLRLVISKPLYDGGAAAANKQAAQLKGVSADIDYAYVRDRYAVTVMQQFLDIILADLQVATETEAMATAFVSMDRAEDNNELGKISDIELLQRQSAYQDARVKVYRSEGEARSTRSLLALTLNRPGQQPSQITPPSFDVSGLVLLEYDKLLEKVMPKNPRMAAANKAIAAAKAKLLAAQSHYKPKVTALFERSENTRETSSSNRWQVGVEMSVPLYDGGGNDAAVRRAHLDVNKLSYDRQQLDLLLRTQLREITEQFRVLNAQADASQAFTDYRELSMDRSRALYELEVKTDLGDAMIQVSAAQLRAARQQFEMALLLAQLNLLAGEPMMQWDALTSKKSEAEGNE